MIESVCPIVSLVNSPPYVVLVRFGLRLSWGLTLSCGTEVTQLASVSGSRRESAYSCSAILVLAAFRDWVRFSSVADLGSQFFGDEDLGFRLIEDRLALLARKLDCLIIARSHTEGFVERGECRWATVSRSVWFVEVWGW